MANEPRANKKRELEEKEGLPIGDILINAMKEHGTISAVAHHLRVAPVTISMWIAGARLLLVGRGQLVRIDDGESHE